ncbi:DUF6223 family protein [Sphaerisporangium sp. TRM90804]|uniref:DUF6223 family protein n=1 Tax=Sphaerisporangium sp. TRM90804 TaxID=3031113 RepID=UPI00244C7DA1|nr:DUF6223 family protein [Sphaerisporangium sp. TRM90804]MDH2425383.1 DUF6223 family protein [Sphaerisporangium sp. TRM90804]
MSVRHLLAAAVLGGHGLAAPAAARVSALLAPVSSYTMTPGRVWAMVGTLIGLVGAVAGGRALTRARRAGAGDGRRGAVVALVAGLVGAAVGGMVVAAAEGGPSTGYGIVGGFIALLIGVIAMVLGGLVLNRARRADRVG